MSEQTLYRLEDLAKRWDVSVKTLRRKIWDGELLAVKLGKVVRVPLAEIQRYERSLPSAVA